MPQLDTVTFFSQLFWLMFFFFGFYGFVLDGVLPNLAQLLKVRMKKMTLQSQRMGSFGTEGREILRNYEASVANTCSDARSLGSTGLANADAWLGSEVRALQRGVFAKATLSVYENQAAFAAVESTIRNEVARIKL